MLNVTFKGEPFLFVGESLAESGALTTVEAYTHGRVSYAHYWPDGDGLIQRYNRPIGTRADLVVVGPADEIKLTLAEMFEGLDNMLGGDPGWLGEPAPSADAVDPQADSTGNPTPRAKGSSS